MQDFGSMMKQAKKLQEKMAGLQKELESKMVEATAGGGMVSVVVNGKFELQSLKIDREVVSPDDVDMLQDLIVAGGNAGIRKAQGVASSEVGKLTGGVA